MSDPLYEFRAVNPRTAEYKARRKDGKWLCLKCRKYMVRDEFGIRKQRLTGKPFVRSDCKECCREKHRKRYVPQTPRLDPRRLLPRVEELENERDAG